MPVITRSINDRGSDARISASLVFGSLCAQTEMRDLEPYLAKVMPRLRFALLDFMLACAPRPFMRSGCSCFSSLSAKAAPLRS